VEDPQPPSLAAEQTIPPALDRIVLKALAKSPADRFQSASEFEAALAELADVLKPPSDWVQSTGFEAVSKETTTPPPAIDVGAVSKTLTLGTTLGAEPAPCEPSKTSTAATETVPPEATPANPSDAVEAVPDTPKPNLQSSRWFLALVFVVAAIVAAGLGMAALRMMGG
jgi:serine/threonine-protein kinase